MSDRVKSEAELIQTFLAPLAGGFAGAFGLTDDCALLPVPAGEELVLTTDAVAAGVHFLEDDTPEDIAWKALAINISDLAAKGARPICYLMSLSFPEPPERGWLADFARGLREAQNAFSISLAGGDTDRRPGPLSVSIVAIGSVPKGRMVRRGTAKPGDKLFVSGTLGDAALGLRLRRQSGLAGAWGLGDDQASDMDLRYRRPQPRVQLRDAVLGSASAAMDLSDGLAKDLGRLCKASGTGARVSTSLLPLSDAVAAAVRAVPSLMTDVLTGGDDFEVLAAVAGGLSQSYAVAAKAAGIPVAEIGEITAGPEVCFEDAFGNPIVLDRSGWDHFEVAP